MTAASWTDYFIKLAATGDPAADGAAFLIAAGREDTLAHCRAVAEEAARLALRYGLDPRRARLAALLHDLAVVVPDADRVVVAESLGLIPDDDERRVPLLLHGPIAAAVLRRLGVNDEEVLAAVRDHTTCRPGATPLQLAVFVADKISLDPAAPVRDFVPAVRAAADHSLERAALVYLDWMIPYLQARGGAAHPNALAARDVLRGSVD
jgi:predicted HD superfamily hydrolase involved in NAD metabolism